MHRSTISRLAFLALIALSVFAPLCASAQTVTPPAIAFALPDGATLHKSAQPTPIAITVSDAIGLRSASISGAYSSATGYFDAGTKSATLRLLFYTNYFPTGDYTFTTSAVNTSGLVTKKSITIHLTP